MLKRRLLSVAVVPIAIAVGLVQPITPALAKPPGPSVSENIVVDQDHGLSFSSNKQNETSITRDPVTGFLIAGANDEIHEGPCPGTTVPGASPCPFVRGVGVSGYYRSADGISWTGGILPGSPGRSSGGDPSLDNGPGRCPDGHFRYSCGTVIYYANLEDPVNPDLHFSEATGVARSFDDGATCQMAVASDGTVEAFWSENEDTTHTATVQVVATSKDGGQTFGAPITISTVVDYPLRGTPFDVVDLFNRVPGMSARVDCFPHPAADPSSTKVYVVWCDFAGGNGSGDVKAAVSSDGLTWTNLGVIAQVANRNAFFPAVGVAPDGTVSVAFDALTAPPDNNPWKIGVQTYDVFYVELPKGGTSFTTPIQVSTASSNPEASSYNNLQ